jgi:hypothetical protein
MKEAVNGPHELDVPGSSQVRWSVSGKPTVALVEKTPTPGDRVESLMRLDLLPMGAAISTMGRTPAHQRGWTATNVTVVFLSSDTTNNVVGVLQIDPSYFFEMIEENFNDVRIKV